MKEHKFYNTTRIVLTLITGLLCLTIGLSLVNMRVSNIKAGIVTKATVIRVITNSDHEDVSYKPILRFINNQNTPMIFKPYAWWGNDWHIGETVKLHYTKDRYDTISMLTFWKTFGIPLHFFCVALISFLIAGGEYVAGCFFKTLNYPQPLT